MLEKEARALLKGAADKLEGAFHKNDTGGKGVLTRDEFFKAVTGAGALDNLHAEALLSALDINRDGLVLSLIHI